MRIDLTDDEARILGAMLRDYLPSLRREVARTDSHEFRHDLVKRRICASGCWGPSTT